MPHSPTDLQKYDIRSINKQTRGYAYGQLKNSYMETFGVYQKQ